MENCPIKFTHRGKEYSGYLTPVMGAGSSSTFHLMVGGYYWGQLFYTDRWVFYGSDPELTKLQDFFGDYVTAWYQ